MDRQGKARRIIAIVCLIPLALLVGCGGSRPLSRPAENPDAEALTEALKRSCVIREQAPSVYISQCPVDVFQQTGRGILRLGRALEVCLADLGAGVAHAANDLALSEGKRVKAEAEAEKYRSQRWWFLGAGLGGGVVLTLLLVLVAGGG